MVRRANFQRPQLRVLNQRVGFKSGLKTTAIFFTIHSKTDYIKLKKRIVFLYIDLSLTSAGNPRTPALAELIGVKLLNAIAYIDWFFIFSLYGFIWNVTIQTTCGEFNLLAEDIDRRCLCRKKTTLIAGNS